MFENNLGRPRFLPFAEKEQFFRKALMDRSGPELPIAAYADEILEAVRLNPVTVVIGETGSGKTTQISQVQRIQTH